MKKALITGITGQDGAYLSRFLLDKGYQVHGLVTDYDRSQLANLKQVGVLDSVSLVSGDLMDLAQLKGLLEELRPDEMYHLAAQSSVAQSFQTPVDTVTFNIQSTQHLLESIRTLALPARFYQASSSEMYGRVKTLPVVEESVFHPVSPYAISKAAGHWLAVNYREAYGLFCCCGILFNHESVLRPPNYVTKKIVSAAVRISRGSREKLTLGNVEIRRDWGYAPEYVKTMWLMLQQDEPDEYVIATSEAHSLRSFAAAAFSCLELDWEEHTIIDRTLLRPSDIDLIYGNPAKARNRLGWEYDMTFDQLVRRLVEEEMAHQEEIQSG
ncbi:MAG: GDP-mannose 4,6-dehydratase [Deltaproteobacteria bacterium HGW-Deltaproteobacteria-19]|jgi:GDPmannose 4,6-dehydratase|nr:MAG: GDP-mannose 4,6-dehydratase [Deltaproteobacteria bacterium HGW-Deltaproteobacteria-19]